MTDKSTSQPADFGRPVVLKNSFVKELAEWPSSLTTRGIREVIVAVGATLAYLPPYSPDLNPIELVFSKLKWLVRNESPRTIDRLLAFLG